MAHVASLAEIESVAYADIRVNPATAPKFYLHAKEVDIWSEDYRFFHSRTTTDYIRDAIKRSDAQGAELFPDVVGKFSEKELLKTALYSGSPILLRGNRGYGKTTISKAISKILPEKLLAIRDCRIHDDPTHPVCFACKWKISHEERVDVTWVPRIWIRIPGDPMLTTRQLIGGVSLQKLREGLDIDHPDVFVPGRALKANRGVGYFDELGAIPSSLQTMLHQLLEEHEVSTGEGEIVPLRIDSVEIASTNPSNYRGTSAIKEPLLDRMEVIDIGPPDSLNEEIEIAFRNSYYTQTHGKYPEIPAWHSRILANIPRLGRNSSRSRVQLAAELSCRATIKLFDHVYSRTERRGGRVPLLVDYGKDNSVIKLALSGRIELDYGARVSKEDFINHLVSESMRAECRTVYEEYLPKEEFGGFLNELKSVSELREEGSFIVPDYRIIERLDGKPMTSSVFRRMQAEDIETKLSAFEIILNSLSVCSDFVSKLENGYLLKEMSRTAEAAV